MEITRKLDLSEQERTLVEMHSALNILNILTYELLNLADLVGSQEALLPSLSLVQEISSALSDRDKTLRQISHIQEKKNRILANVEEAAGPFRTPPVSDSGDHGLPDSTEGKVEKSIENIDSLLTVLEVRAKEIISREGSSTAWKPHKVDVLKKNMHEIFNAFEQNSKWRYSIVYDESAHDKHSYLVCCDIRGDIHGEKENVICMPPELQDVFRDLTANARKYTEPGGYIHASLDSDGRTLKLRVEDTGRGIPDDQIESIVEYGYRARNVDDKKNYGGGFGLTKAYYITKKYYGRMWIDSEAEKGTVVTIHIPVLDDACSSEEK